MLGLPASAGAPVVTETGGLAVSQLLPPWSEVGLGLTIQNPGAICQTDEFKYLVTRKEINFSDA